MLRTAPGAETAAQIAPAGRLEGELVLPGDKSISHRALMLALLANGEPRISGAGDGADVRSTAGIVKALGARLERQPAGEAGNVDYTVTATGGAGLRRPAGVLDCGNSGTSLRLFAGIVAGHPIEAILDGDASLRARPMARVIAPLSAMGARVEGARDGRPPLVVAGRRRLQPIDWHTPVPSAQVKSAILLAGLSATGRTTVRESVATRDHTERMLQARGVPVRTRPAVDGWAIVEVDGPATVSTVDERVPGDPSAAAFWLVAAAIHPDADLLVRRVGVNPTRRAAVDFLSLMGAAIDERPIIGAALAGVGEPVADIRVRSSGLRAIQLMPADTARAIDEVPILCLAATQARGRTVIRGAGELRHKESDRIAGIVAGLSTLGARISVDGDDISIDGPTTLRGAVVDSLNDHRLALTFAIAGLVAEGATTVLGADSVDISYPTFFADLERIRS